MTELPIEAVLPELRAALEARNMAVVQASPGAGKTTRVPLFLLDQNLCAGKILVLEPRRLAARAAAERMSEILTQKTGETVGYRMRDDAKIGPNTRIEVITEGIFTRIAQNDPELTGIGCVIFDEFHERNLQADTGLAFALEIREALRPDLSIIAMSATFDPEPVSNLMGNAPIVTSSGRSFTVTQRHLQKPWSKPGGRGPRFENAAADLIYQAANETEGGILAFLPGEGEIRRVQSLLQSVLPASIHIRPLYGAIPFAEQRRAILREPSGRKLVLATSIAQTSLTIEDVRVVVDCGRSRRARFDAGCAMTRLVTERVTKAEAIQREGRAGRVAEGICYKLWTRGEEGGFAPYPPAEILSADISRLILELAVWGTTDPKSLSFLDHPRKSDVDQAQELLRKLGALDERNQITDHGRALIVHPLHPRLAHMLELGGPDAPLIAALVEGRDPLPQSAPSDLNLRIEALRDPQKFAQSRPYTLNLATLKTIRSQATRLKAGNAKTTRAQTVALAYPDRIGLRRKGDAARYVLSGGKGAIIASDDPTSTHRLIVATELDGDTTEARVRMCIPITQSELAGIYGGSFERRNICVWSKRQRRVLARKQIRLGALILEDQSWKDCPANASNRAMCEGIRDLGLSCLPWTQASQFLCNRVTWLTARGHKLPDLSETTLLNTLSDWLAAHLDGIKTVDRLKSLDLATILRNQLDWSDQQALDNLAPGTILAPTGTRLAIDYKTAQPRIAVRLQELFGMTTHPSVGPGKVPLLIELLSPARRPVQTTADLPGFWANSYADVRKSLRGRYPKHPWPEDPTRAQPTRRVKPKT